MNENLRMAEEEFERVYAPFFAWAIEQGAAVFAQAYAYATAMGQVQWGARMVSFGGVEFPDLWGFLLAAVALRDMARAAGFALLANECERARRDAAEVAEMVAVLIVSGLLAEVG